MVDITERLTTVPEDAAPYARAVRTFAGEPPSGNFSLDKVCRAFHLQMFNVGFSPRCTTMKPQLFPVEGGFRVIAGPSVINNPVRVCEEIAFALGHILFYNRSTSTPFRADEPSEAEDAFCVEFAKALFEGRQPLALNP